MDVKVKRLMKDIADFFKQDDPPLFKYVELDDNMEKVVIEIKGPDDSPYQGGTFVLEFEIPLDFPCSPPSITCRTPVWHPNISLTGAVCMNLLDVSWSAGTSLIELAEGVRALLINPNPHSPLNSDAAALLRFQPCLYDDNTALWTNYLAGGNASPSEELREGLGILVALGLDLEWALQKGAISRWDMPEASKDL